MVFSTTTFCFFFLPLFLLVDFALRKTLFRNIFLIFASLLFYVWGEGSGILLLVILALFNLAMGHWLINTPPSNQTFDSRVLILILGITINLLVLFFFKYFFWIASEFAALFGLILPRFIHSRALPLGISFFTFHAISYLIDIYRGIVGQHNSVTFMTYFFMFPHLVAGPIVRFESIRQALLSREYDTTLFAYGIYRFILGLNKKLLIANSVAPIADLAFAMAPDTLGCSVAWLGILAYTVQIYFDFSGYSDMAIGLAAMVGIRFQENFHCPYQATSIRDFWRRWHVSLSSWFRDYLYIPLGGSRCVTRKIYRNLIIVFIVCGLWHGAQYTFVCWGLLHGVMLVLERTPAGKRLDQLPRIFQRLYCMFFVVMGWVLFRSDSIARATEYAKAMFSFHGNNVEFSFGLFNISALVIGLAITLFSNETVSDSNAQRSVLPRPSLVINAVVLPLSLIVLYSGSRNPFIYFNF